MTAHDTAPSWTVSVISHGHGARILRCVEDIHRWLSGIPHAFVLTFNAGEDVGFLDRLPEALRANIRVIRNSSPRGFAANHNAALRGARSRFVLAADPDLSIEQDIFSALHDELARPERGIVAPLAYTSAGRPDDNGRRLATPRAVLLRAVAGRSRDLPPAGYTTAREVDWLAGLFLALRAETFEALGGFDERYFMYCEDVDICLRARQLGLTILQRCDLRVTHDANRRTLKRPRHLSWHVASLLRLWRSPAYRAARS
ncbi:MAG TPA: glycosyltransferase [Fontimonas sp.]